MAPRFLTLLAGRNLPKIPQPQWPVVEKASRILRAWSSNTHLGQSDDILPSVRA
jgi:hypothetical protein